MAIRSPMEWGWDMVRRSALFEAPLVLHEQRLLTSAELQVRRIDLSDIKTALTRGMEDFGSGRTDVIFLCVFYPIVGLLLARLAFGEGIVQLLFPLAAGFALIGPLAAVGLNEMSRRRETVGVTGWGDAFGVLRSPSLGGIVTLGVVMMMIFLVWMVVAAGIYALTMGALPTSAAAFASAIFTTGGGFALMVLGVGTGFVFAVAVLSISIVSFPLLLDRRVTAATAIATSIRMVKTNPTMAALWGLIVVAGLVAGSIPLFFGLAIVLPVLGHATWHLYRAAIRPTASVRRL